MKKANLYVFLFFSIWAIILCSIIFLVPRFYLIYIENGIKIPLISLLLFKISMFVRQNIIWVVPLIIIILVCNYYFKLAYDNLKNKGLYLGVVFFVMGVLLGCMVILTFIPMILWHYK